MKALVATMYQTWLLVAGLYTRGVHSELSANCLYETLPPHMMEWQDNVADSSVMVEWAFGKVRETFSYLFLL